MQSWEYVLIAVGLAFVILTVYLIVTLNKLRKTLDDLDALVMKNTEDITSLIGNIESISSDAKGAVKTLGRKYPGASGALNAISRDGGFEMGSTLKALVGTAGFVFSAFKLLKGYSDQKKIKKLMKNAERTSKK